MGDNGEDNSTGGAGGGGGRSLGSGAPVPAPSLGQNNPSSGGPRIGQPSSGSRPGGSGGGRFATLNDITSSGGPPRGRPQQRPPNTGDDDDDDDDGGENWYTGGERSGLSVENPARQPAPGSAGLNTVRDILRKAAEGGPPPEASGQSARGSRPGVFSGAGNTLGSDEVPSTFVPDPDAPAEDDEEIQAETAVREITFWRDGFSIQDGPLMRYDDPNHSQILEQINSGNAPPSILNVQVGQPVELRVSRRVTEDYTPPPKRFQAFEGSGNRLGAPVPLSTATATSSNSSSTGQPPGAFPTSSGTSSSEDRASMTTKFAVDMNLPTTSVQIRLADGTRLVARMNLTHTVGDIRGFINASRPGQSATPYTIGTTFPNRILEDNSQTIQAAGLQNSVVVQRLI